MSYNYNAENAQFYVSSKENSYRIGDAGGTTDETNDATDVVFPLQIRLTKAPYFFKKRRKEIIHTPGQPDYGYIGFQGWEKGAVNLQGELYNFSQMYFLCSGCTTTGPASSYYTHTYATTTARTATPPTFQLFYKLTNDTSGNTKLWLFTGCILKRCTVYSQQNDKVYCAMEIHFANVVAATALTTPGYPLQPLYVHNFEGCAITYTVGAAAYGVKVVGFHIEYDNGSFLHKGSGEEYPAEALHGWRKIAVKVDVIPKTDSDFSDANTAAPATASDIDLIIKILNASGDYTQFSFEKLWGSETDGGTFSYQDYYLQRSHTYILKPVAYEAGAKLTIVDYNLYTNARYEGA